MQTAKTTDVSKGLLSLLLALSCLVFFATTAFAADTYQYSGKGTVTFNHAAHQKLISCDNCHSGATPEKITIENKKQGHGLCLSCHKKQKKEGNKAVPTKCNQCHVK